MGRSLSWLAIRASRARSSSRREMTQISSSREGRVPGSTLTRATGLAAKALAAGARDLERLTAAEEGAGAAGAFGAGRAIFASPSTRFYNSVF